MKRKEKIKEIIIVEGKTDSDRLKSIFDVETFQTNGLSLNKNKLEYIKKLSQTKGIILFLDPDFTGEKIRKQIIEEIPKSKNCFIDLKTSFELKDKKKGIAEAKESAIILALKKQATFIKDNESIKWNEYLLLNIYSQKKRDLICDYFNIGKCNNKQLFKRLNMLNISFDECKKILS